MRFYLGEEPILPNVQTYRLEEPAELHQLGLRERRSEGAALLDWEVKDRAGSTHPASALPYRFRPRRNAGDA